MRIYETLMILHPEITEEGIGSLLEKIEGIIEKSGGKITEIDQWGVRKLAYRIAKQPRGYYTLLKYAASPTIIREMERNLKLLEECLRFMTVKISDEATPETIAQVERVHKKPPAAAGEVEEEEPAVLEPQGEFDEEEETPEPPNEDLEKKILREKGDYEDVED